MDGGRPREGKLRRVGDHAEFDVEKYMGQPVSRQSEEFQKVHAGFKLTHGKDPDKLTLDDAGSEEVILTRSEKPLDSH